MRDNNDEAEVEVMVMRIFLAFLALFHTNNGEDDTLIN
jgi:hypothetical protein